MKYLFLFASLLLIASPSFASGGMRVDLQNGVIHSAARLINGSGDIYLDHFFGNVTIGTSAFTTLGITNDGVGDLEIKSISIWGPSFSYQSNCPSVLHDHRSCTIQIEYRPFFAGYETDQLDVLLGDGGHIYLNLSGYGQH